MSACGTCFFLLQGFEEAVFSARVGNVRHQSSYLSSTSSGEDRIVAHLHTGLLHTCTNPIENTAVDYLCTSVTGSNPEATLKISLRKHTRTSRRSRTGGLSTPPLLRPLFTHPAAIAFGLSVPHGQTTTSLLCVCMFQSISILFSALLHNSHQ